MKKAVIVKPRYPDNDAPKVSIAGTLYFKYQDNMSEEMGCPIFLITPKQLFDDANQLADSFYANSHVDLPRNLFLDNRGCEFCYYGGTRQDGERYLLARGHEENDALANYL